MKPAPFLAGAYLLPERVPEERRYPFELPVVRDLRLEFESAVTIFVGENGSGKSTVLQALAVLSRLPAAGGGRDQLSARPRTAADLSTALAGAMRPSFRRRPRHAWFFRADMHDHFAAELAARGGHHALGRDPDALFADRRLETLSHGEGFLATVNNRAREGLLLFDEPESALSPQRQLTLLALLARAVSEGSTQIVMATHSPILMTFPGAQLLSFDGERIEPIHLEETSHYQLTRDILECPERYWKHLIES